MSLSRLSTQATLYSYNGGWIQEKLQERPSIDQDLPFSGCILTWNIDFMAALLRERFQAALAHLESLLSPNCVSPPPPPTIVLIQEMHHTCFKVLLENQFVREFYHLSNIEAPHTYSTITLVPRALAPLVSAVGRVPFGTATRMKRDCLYVDLDVPYTRSHPAPGPAGAGSDTTPTLRVRMANTHLESLDGVGEAMRQKQLEAISDLLKADDVAGGLVAGDMNCIGVNDRDLPVRMGLVDAWLVAKGLASEPESSDTDSETGEAKGHTWGYQPRGRYPPRRMDKILTAGKLEAVDIQRVGVGLKVEGSGVWVSDHYGLLARLVLRP
ncbi:hypothetical protein GGX14DRAFT_364184 [Mycena pura]|uniref:Endonuclease/exonuclease/phosphatase domain-containing protein n=1 Tax=Mycena pura TaxID=153505 RepID=A0AAD6VFH0_9AGAR|nr:hypothetical protein GGX14DRAFT_364184 [Mycena pura]